MFKGKSITLMTILVVLVLMLLWQMIRVQEFLVATPLLLISIITALAYLLTGLSYLRKNALMMFVGASGIITLYFIVQITLVSVLVAAPPYFWALLIVILVLSAVLCIKEEKLDKKSGGALLAAARILFLLVLLLAAMSLVNVVIGELSPDWPFYKSPFELHKPPLE